MGIFDAIFGRPDGRKVGPAGITYDPRVGDVKPRHPQDDRPTANGSKTGCWWATAENDPRNQKK